MSNKGNPHMDAHQKSLDSMAKGSPFRTWRRKGLGSFKSDSTALKSKRKKWRGGKEKALKKFSNSRPSYYKDK